MSTHFRKTKLDKFIKRLEVRLQLYEDDDPRKELLKEIIAELRHEFKIKEGE